MDRIARVAARAQAHVDAGAFSGIEWHIRRFGEVWTEGQVGMADALAGTPMPNSPIYRVYSMTKPIVAAAALMLIEEGRMRLMDPVAKYIPAFARTGVLDADGNIRKARTPITVEHLFTHQSGLSYGFLLDCPVAKLYRDASSFSNDMSLEALVDAIANHPLAFDPGSDWRYSVSTDVLARVIEVIEGAPLGDVLKRRIFDPLKLKDTAFFVPQSERYRIMTMFGQGDLNRIQEFSSQTQSLAYAEGDFSSPANNPNFARGGHGLFSTTDDYTAIARFLANGYNDDGEVMLARKSIEALWTNRVDESQMPLRIGPIQLPGYGYGLGGRVLVDQGKLPGFSSNGECGWAGAASTYFWIDPAEDVIGIVMTQYLGSVIPLGDDMRDATYQALD